MAMETIATQLVTQFSDMMHIKQQQLKSRLRAYCDIREMRGDSYAYDGLGTVEARELEGRFNETIFDDLEHFRRKIGRREFSVTLPFDEYDLRARLTDPSAQYAQEATAAMERAFDRVVYGALFATVQYGRNFENSVSSTTDGVLTVNATAGLGLAQVLAIKQNFIDGECLDAEEFGGSCFGISGEEHTTLMQIQQLTSSLYTNQMAVERGRMVSALGLDFVVFGQNVTLPLIPVVGGVRQCFAMGKKGVAVGLNLDWQITIKDRPDLVNVKQIQITGALGAVRTEGKLVQLVTTTM